MNDENGLSDAAEKFLERDYIQCFTQLRHYDGQNVDLLKFTFTAYLTVIGVSIGLFQFTFKGGTNFVPVAVSILALGFVFGVFMFSLIVRNRVYYVVLARYINEHRQHFLGTKPLGFQNRARMYTNAERPRFFHWRSSQAFHLYLIASLNALLAAALVISVQPWWYSVMTFVVTVLGQLAPAIAYLMRRENKSVGAAVFGTDESSDILVS